MKKNLLIALALPAMFAACSQEDVISNGNLQAGLLGTPAGEIDFVFDTKDESRAAWGADGKLSWSPTDAFSLFWVGDQNGESSVFTSATNALYTSEGEGEAFTSKNIVYVGKHILVYPADYTHVTNKAILVSVGDEQDASKTIGERTVLVSELLNIQERPAKESDREEGVMYAGYAEPVVASASPLSSNLALNLNFTMNDNIDEVVIKSVELEASADIFAFGGNLKVNTDGFMSLSPTSKGKLITLEMPEETTVTKDSPKYKAEISLLPPVADNLNDDVTYTIRVNTNFGIVTIDKAKLVTNAAGKYQIAEGTGYNETVAETITAETALSFNTEFTNIAVRTKGDTDAESEKSYGYQIARNVAVNMATAEINGMKIANSDDLLDAYNVFDLLEKDADDKVAFVLVGEKAKGETLATFSLTPAAAEAIAEHPVTLEVADDCSVLKLTNTADEQYAAVPDLTGALGEATASLELVLGEGAWALNVKDAAIVNAYTKLINEGALAISDVAVSNGKALAVGICNKEKIEVIGTVNLNQKLTQVAEASTIVGSDAYLYLNGGAEISGDVIADGTFAVHNNIVNLAADASVTVAGSFLTATSGTTHNLGTIALSGEGTAQVTTNQAVVDGNTVMGSIVLANRNSMATVYEKNAQGYIKWNCLNEASFIPATSDAFNCLVLTNNINLTDKLGTVNHIVIAGGKVRINKHSGQETDLKLGLEEQGDDTNVLNVAVAAGATLVVPVDVEIEASTTNNNGAIEVYGIYTTVAEPTGDGKIYYFNNQRNVANAASLQAAVTDGALIVMTENIELTEALNIPEDVEATLDLNGKTLTMAKPVYEGQTSAQSTALINVNGGNLTIKGGTIDARIEYDADERVAAENAGALNVSVAAVHVKSGKVIIESGRFETGSDKMAAWGENSQLAGVPVIEAWDGSEVVINGGSFEAAYPCSAGDGNYKWMVLNRCGEVTSGIFTVNAGDFINYNPSVGFTDAGGYKEDKTMAEGSEVSGLRMTTGSELEANGKGIKKDYNETGACTGEGVTTRENIKYTVAVSAD